MVKPRKRKPGNTQYDYAELKMQFFLSEIQTVRPFFVHEAGIKWHGGLDKYVKGRAEEKKQRSAKKFEIAKAAAEKAIKDRTIKFYEDMHNVLMSHANSLIEKKEVIIDGVKTKVPVFSNLKEARLAIQEVRTFNKDTNTYRDPGITDTPPAEKMADVQFIFTDEKDESS